MSFRGAWNRGAMVLVTLVSAPWLMASGTAEARYLDSISRSDTDAEDVVYLLIETPDDWAAIREELGTEFVMEQLPALLVQIGRRPDGGDQIPIHNPWPVLPPRPVPPIPRPLLPVPPDFRLNRNGELESASVREVVEALRSHAGVGELGWISLDPGAARRDYTHRPYSRPVVLPFVLE